MSIRTMTAIAIFAAFIAVFSQFSVLIGPVPHTLQIFAVTLAGIVLGAKRGAFAVLIWILLGAFGLPVFAMAQGSLSVVFGPLIGFFFGFIVHAWICGCVRVKNFFVSFLGGAVSLAFVYFLGVAGFWAEYNYILGKSLSVGNAFAACAAPFIIFDLLKLAAAVVAGRRILKILAKAGMDLS